MANLDLGVLANVVAAGVEGPMGDAVIATFVDEKGGTFETRTYRQLYDNANAFAAHMIDHGMEKGDRFAVLLQNHPETMEALIAASIAGTVAVPVDPRTKGEKLSYVLADADCRGIVCADYNAAEVAAVVSASPSSWTVLLGDKAPEAVLKSLPQAAAAQQVFGVQREPVEVRSTSGLDTLQILYTSGTTGDPKGIVKSNLGLTIGSALAEVCCMSRDDVLYTGLSLTHGNAQGFTMAPSLCAGIPAVYSRRFTKSGLWKTIREFDCTIFTLLGGMTIAVYAEPPADDDADNPVRMVISAGMPASIWKQFEERFDLRLFEVYGAAEGGLFWNDGSGPVGSIGNVSANPLFEARIVDEDDNDVAAGKLGELIWRNRDGNPVIVEYLNNPDASSDKARDGWFRTGDVVHADADGWMFFDFRKGGGIRRNGDFINPGFVEKALAEIDCVGDVFVYGVAGENMAPGEQNVVAAIVADEVTTFDADEVFAQCREKLESNFVPSFLQVVSEIPKTASEKPQERFLRERFAPDAAGVFTQ